MCALHYMCVRVHLYVVCTYMSTAATVLHIVVMWTPLTVVAYQPMPASPHHLTRQRYKAKVCSASTFYASTVQYVLYLSPFPVVQMWFRLLGRVRELQCAKLVAGVGVSPGMWPGQERFGSGRSLSWSPTRTWRIRSARPEAPFWHRMPVARGCGQKRLSPH